MVSTAGAPSGPVEVPDTLLPGAKAGPWIVERELGRGGMGAVYAVVHEEIGKRAALKVVHARIMTPGFNADRMLLEAKVVNQVGHPNIVDIFETGRLSDGRPYIVMERLEGQPLAYRADDGKILPDQVIAILLQVCDALIAAHAANVIHRDLKLDNVFLVDNPDDPSTPRVKLLDWGIAKVLTHDVRHTVEGQLVGTPQYLAPEQARGAMVSPATDVYSLGVMAYELFLEQLPFEAETSAEIMAMHLRATPPPPRELWPDIPDELEALILSMLAKNPEHRPSMLEVARKLEEVGAMLKKRCDEHGTPRTTRGTPAPASRPVLPGVPSVIVSPQLLAASAKIEVMAPRLPPQTPRLGTNPGLAPTLAAEEPHRGHRWQWAVGALAIVASAAMFLLSRGGDSAAAAALGTSDVRDIREMRSDTWKLDAPAPPRAAQPPVVTPAVASDTVTAELIDASLDDVVIPDADSTKNPPARKPPTSRATKHDRSTSMAYRPSTRKDPVAPRRATKIDPDGTIDPYR
ncbi:MAG TPA: serine/threonine-protein kinase [Kofleriaceae bacterium]|nr:serine/threonine-protein kinase [Kofleriaceae bacterium]